MNVVKKSVAVSVILIFSLISAILPPFSVSAEANYPEVTVNGVTMPLPEYLPGTYFTKNGKACTCHNSSSINCVSSPSKCNCLRYVTVDGVDYDLRGVQCIGFARYVFLRLFGFPDTVDHSSKYSSVGSLSYGNVNASTVKELISKAKPGAHMRFNLSSSQHSVVILKIEENGFYVYHGNSGGDGYSYEQCIVTTKYYTYADFASYAYRGIVYVNMPNEYPGEIGSTVDRGEDLMAVETVGVYLTKYNLNLRAEASAESDKLAVMPADTAVFVLSRKDGFGQIWYDGKLGYASLDYLEQVSAATQNFIAHPNESGLVLSFANPRFKLIGTNGDSTSVSDGENVYTETVVNAKTNAVYTIKYGEQTVLEFTAALLGDVSCSGKIDLTDYIKIKMYMKGIDELTEAQKIAADCDYSGSVDTFDYFVVKRILCSN